MQAKTERFEMRLDQRTIDRIDTWRGRQTDLPSRAEAVRRLMESGLVGVGEGDIALSAGEKLILMMLCELYKHLNIKGDIEPDFIEAAIHGGHYWGLEWKYPGMFHGYQADKQVVSEVVDILDMWSFIERGYEQLSTQEKERIEKDAAPLGKYVKFSGFDGNNESEQMGVAHFLIEQLERFTWFKGRNLNAHMPTLDAYRRMLAVYEPMRTTLIGKELSATQIIELLRAMMHPENRK